ncbi:hypothetical protein LLG95_01415 [bacterium]|nr:hypothetical protein [bacterium]
MNMNDAPFQLDQGLALERPIVLLRWDAPIDVLARKGRPAKNHSTPEPGAFLVWKDGSIFNGLQCDILYRSDLPNAFRINLHLASSSEDISEGAKEFVAMHEKDPSAALELFLKRFDQTRKDLMNSIRKGYHDYLAELTNRLGPPTGFDNKIKRPWARWNFGPVCVSFRIGEIEFPGPLFLVLSISKPDTPPVPLDIPRVPDLRFSKVQQIYQDRVKKADANFRNVCWREVFPDATPEEMREWNCFCEQMDHYSWDLADLARNNMIDEANAKRMLAAHFPMLTDERIDALYNQAMYETMW